MKTIILLLARGWYIKYVEPASGLTDYWHVDETESFDFAGITDSVQTTKCPFWLEVGRPARLRPLKESANGDTAFYLEIASITDAQLLLALWVKYSSEENFRHRLTYELVPHSTR